MTKESIMAELKARGEFETNKRNELWAKAFQLYAEATRQRLSQNCGNCWTKVRQWLQS